MIGDGNEVENSMKKTIFKLQAQVNQLIALIKNITPLVMYDDERKKEIIDKMNEISEMEINVNDSDEVEENHPSLEEKKSKPNKEVGKRKEKSSKTTALYHFKNDEESKGRISYLNQWFNEERIDGVQTK